MKMHLIVYTNFSACFLPWWNWSAIESSERPDFLLWLKPSPCSGSTSSPSSLLSFSFSAHLNWSGLVWSKLRSRSAWEAVGFWENQAKTLWITFNKREIGKSPQRNLPFQHVWALPRSWESFYHPGLGCDFYRFEHNGKRLHLKYQVENEWTPQVGQDGSEKEQRPTNNVNHQNCQKSLLFLETLYKRLAFGIIVNIPPDKPQLLTYFHFCTYSKCQEKFYTHDPAHEI